MRNFDILRDADKVTGAIRQALEKQERFADQVSQHIGRLEASLDETGYAGLHLLSLLAPLCGDVDPQHSSWAPESIFVAGTGPWNEEDLRRFFEDLGFDVADDFDTAGAIVLGSSNVDKNLLENFAEFSDLPPVYSQEVFVIGLIRDTDPFELLDQEHIDNIADIHDPIQQLLQLGVTWPNSSAWIQDEDEDEDEAQHPDFVPSFDLSPQLEAVIGPGPLRRAEVVAKLWTYIKFHGLQDADDHRKINCDSRLTDLFGKQQVGMFEIPEMIARHVK